jgi:hypothetical protein
MGGIIIAVLVVVGSIINLITTVSSDSNVAMTVIGLILAIAVAVLLLMGILREMPILMIPAIVIMVRSNLPTKLITYL